MRGTFAISLALLVAGTLFGGSSALAYDGFDLPLGAPVPTEYVAPVLAEEEPAVEEEPPSFYGEEVAAETSIIYVIDRSGSMTIRVGNYTTPEGGVVYNASRWDIARTELRYSIQNLSSDMKFNVIFYGSCISQWRSQTVRATEENKVDACAYVDSTTPGGWTNTAGAVMTGLAERSNVTVVLLSDGSPNFLDCAETQIAGSSEHRRLIREANLQNAQIHAFAIDPTGDARAFMQGVAADNSGMYVEIN